MLRSLDKDANAALLVAVGAMSIKAKAYCDQLLSLSDHTQADLTAQGHPYAKRDPQPIHDPIEQVHEQTGALRRGLTVTKPVATRGQIMAQVYNAEQPLDSFIQLGTRTMIARPYMALVRRLYHEAIEAIGIAVINRWLQDRRVA